MIFDLQLSLTPKEASLNDVLRGIVASKIDVDEREISEIRIIKKSIDSRKGFPRIILQLKVYVGEKSVVKYENDYHYQDVRNGKEVLIVGAGPAGLFAALRLIEHGCRPIILERGKKVEDRKKDIAQLNRNVKLDKESNYCFGEGGAGTFSDGKLYTRSKKRGNSQRVLEIFHQHGAQDEILYEAHAHIGTDVLPSVIKNIRKRIVDCGGEIRFEKKMSELLIDGGKVCGVKYEDGMEWRGENVVLATGHSARDVYYALAKSGVELEAKGFAMGVRVEHPQSLIDSIQYHCRERSEYLPAATYNLVTQVDGRGVYSFCMCPGGHIVPSSSDDNQLVVNGMSSSRRNSPYANSGIAVEIRPEDLPEYSEYGPLACLKFQEHLEYLSYTNNGGLGQKAPAQRLLDFVKGRLSSSLPECSYIPGVISSPLHFWLPENIGKRLQKAFVDFNKKMKGYLTNDAIILGVESRTSSPVRIPRDKETFEQVNIKGLYPCGEGSGYAGGITSSAVDGEKCADAIAEKLKLFIK